MGFVERVCEWDRARGPSLQAVHGWVKCFHPHLSGRALVPFFPHYWIYECVTFKRSYCSNWVLSYRVWNHVICICIVICGMCWRNGISCIHLSCCMRKSIIVRDISLASGDSRRIPSDTACSFREDLNAVLGDGGVKRNPSNVFIRNCSTKHIIEAYRSVSIFPGKI